MTERQIIEWPQAGSRQWWIVEEGPHGYRPIEGSFRTRAAAEARRAALDGAPAQPAAPCRGACPSCPGRGAVR